MNRLLYCGQSPGQGMGSPVVILRHLQRLAGAGWQIGMAIPWGDPKLQEAGWRDWKVAELPHRRPSWPPYCPFFPPLRRFRHWLWAGELNHRFKSRPPDVLLTYLAAHSPLFSEIAAAYARRFRVPLITLVHDDPVAFSKPPRAQLGHLRPYRDVLAGSRRIGFVSPELARAFGFSGSENHLLLPLPEGFHAPAEWSSGCAGCPKVVYAGAVWPPQIPLLTRLARAIADEHGRLVLITKPTSEVLAMCQLSPVDLLPPFLTNIEALQWLTTHASGLAICYAEDSDQMPWIRTSFPSKLVEYCHLGIPLLIVAPHDAAVSRWACRRGFPHVATPDQMGCVRAWVRQLTGQASWETLREAPLRLARGEFNPFTIHQTLEQWLTECQTAPSR